MTREGECHPLMVVLVVLLLFSSAMLWRQLRFLRDRVVVLEGVAPVNSEGA